MQKDRYIAMGLMSGTSLDGVDSAIIETDGVDIFEIWPQNKESCVAFDDIEVDVDMAQAVRAAVDWGFKGPPPNILSQLEQEIDRLHIMVIERQRDAWLDNFLPEAPSEGRSFVDIVGYHGLTVLHHPPMNGTTGRTLQLGRGQVLADRLGLPVAYDFRTADVAAGGQGAPLAPVYHEALVRHSELQGRIAVVNIGGVSNVSAIENGVLRWATDCGPGNGPLDQWIGAMTDRTYDIDGRLSLAGAADHGLINQWLERDFFRRTIPRSADRYDFDVLTDLKEKSTEDGAATLASFCAQAIARDVEPFGAERVIVCGGGRKNRAIMEMLDIHIDAKIQSAEDVGWNGDMLEAQAFAYLAVRTLRSLPISFPDTTGAPKPMTGGRIAYP